VRAIQTKKPLNFLIRLLMNTTDFHLHALHSNERSTKLYKHFVEHMVYTTKEAIQIKSGRGKKTLDRITPSRNSAAEKSMLRDTELQGQQQKSQTGNFGLDRESIRRRPLLDGTTPVGKIGHKM
jgi:hypothetical protein